MTTHRLTARLAFVLLALLPVLAHSAACGLQSSAGSGPTLRFPSGVSTVTAGSDLYGGSTLYHVDDDAFWRSPVAAESLRRAGVRTLRYPGGKLAGNYDWETNSLQHPDEFPREAKTQADKDARTDYLEFLAAARRIGVEDVFFVVNIDSAVRAPGNWEQNLEASAEKAAKWVKAVKDHGYSVKYWEIGNENYFSGRPVTAKEYAHIVTLFSKRMKAVDPTIKIAAIGPNEPRDEGFADKIGPESLKEFRAKKAEGDPKPCDEDCERAVKRKGGGKGGKHRKNAADDDIPKWWTVLAAEAIGSFDIAVIHRYRLPKFPAGAGRPFPATDSIEQIKHMLSTAKGKEVQIAMTEWNLPGELHRNQTISAIDYLMSIGIYLGNNAVGGVDYAMFWPFRMRTKDPGTLLTKDGQLTDVGRLFEATSNLIPNAPVAEAALSPDVYALKIGGKGSVRGGLVVNRGATPVTVEFADGIKGKASVRSFVGGADGEVTDTPCATQNVDAGPVRVSAPPKSITILSLQPG